jgi:hypothetical protein
MPASSRTNNSEQEEHLHLRKKGYAQAVSDYSLSIRAHSYIVKVNLSENNGNLLDLYSVF